MKENRFDIFSSSVLQVARSVQVLKSRKMAEYDLKGTNVLCLCVICRSEEKGLSATELSRECEIDKAQVSRCMKELIDKGLVYRNDQEGRRYKQKYILTEKGIEVAKDMIRTADRVQAVLRKGISADELERFYKTLQTVCENGKMLPKE